ncbi:MAG: isochorismate synthase, partial [Acidimicrobiales bacterium]
IRATVGRIRAGELSKVVLARRVDVTANRDLPTSEIVGRLRALYPSCMVFRMGGFLGASPELLVRRRGEAVASHPLAGTVARSGDATADRGLVDGLRASVKERAEHAFVVDDLRSHLGPFCAELSIPDEPSVLELRNVSHLATRLNGRLRPDRRRPTALELVAAVHPTPAVGGTPTEAACAYLAEVEGFDRGPYAGAVGWVDAAGDGDWAVGIRCATVEGPRASLYAGVGVVADSDPAAELAESQLKLQALLAAVVRP